MQHNRLSHTPYQQPHTPYQQSHAPYQQSHALTVTHNEKELYTSRHPTQISSRRLSSHKRVVFPIISFILTFITILGILKCVHCIFFPVIYTTIKYARNIFVGEDMGVQCTIWSNSPLQQLRCTLLSFTNGYLVSFVNDLSRELLTKQWGALPTCIGYLFPTCGALYLNYVYIVRRFLCFLWFGVLSLYKIYYLALNNPMMPFDYIEQSILTDMVD
jgi:hypothetical protein